MPFIQGAVLRAVEIQRELAVSTRQESARSKFKCVGPAGEEGQWMSGSLR